MLKPGDRVKLREATTLETPRGDRFSLQAGFAAQITERINDETVRLRAEPATGFVLFFNVKAAVLEPAKKAAGLPSTQ